MSVIELKNKSDVSAVKVWQKPLGPIVIEGATILVTSENGQEIEHRSRISVCGCGLSKSPPYCDGSHKF